MKSVRITGKKQAEIVDVPTLRAVGDFAVVKILAAPMCTEYKAYREGWEGDSISHEAAGDYIHCRHLVDVARATGNTTGRATYAQFLLKQDWLLLPMKDGVSLEHGAMACCGLGPTFGAMLLKEMTDSFARARALLGDRLIACGPS